MLVAMPHHMRHLTLVPFACLCLAFAPASVQPHSDAQGLPFGLFGMGGRRLVDPFTSGMQNAQPGTILQDLEAARARGAHMVVTFAGAPVKFTDPAGHFDYDMWKARVDRFLPLVGQIQPYVTDGTLLATLIIDEPFSKQRWNGTTVPKETIDRMGQYSKSLFPGLAVAVREAPTDLAGYPWKYVDVSWAQYASRKGPIDRFVSTESAAARADGLGLIVGLNLVKGGDGSSGLGTDDEPAMSGAEILRDGRALLAAPNACAFISWDDRPDVIDRPDAAAALRELATVARTRPSTACR